MKNLKVFSLNEFLNLNIPAKEYLLEPWLPKQGIAMVYSPTGVGKTWFCIGTAFAVSTGTIFLKWGANKSHGVLYIDGEMQAYNLIERLKYFNNSLNNLNSKTPLFFLPNDLQDTLIPDLANFEGQNFIDQKINELQQISGVRIELIIIDNLSSLLRTGDENDAESWLPFQNWLLDLRRRNISILFAHHANKEGYQRGTSRRTDIADSVISLRFPQKQSYDLCDFSFEVHFEKTRGAMEQGYESFLAKMTRHDGQNNLPEMFWEYESVVNDSTYKKVIDLMKQGKNQKEVAEILKIHKGTVSKHVNRARSEGKFLS